MKEMATIFVVMRIALFQFASLASTMKKLWLDDNQLEVFPIAICQLVNLTELRLSGNELKSLPLSISSLSDLHTLVILSKAQVKMMTENMSSSTGCG